MTLDEADRIAVALAVLRKRHVRIDGEALAWLLMERWGREIAERALVHGFGLTCGADDACGAPEAPDPDRLEAARAILVEEGMGDLVEHAPMRLVQGGATRS